MNLEIENLKENVQDLLKSNKFSDLSVIYLAIALERMLKNVIIFNYRKAGFSAAFIRKRLLDKMSYAQLLSEFEWSSPDKLNLTKIWASKQLKVKDLSGIMSARNKVMHSNGNVPPKDIQQNVNELHYVIEKLSVIFSDLIGYDGFKPLPKTFPQNQLKLSSKMLHKSIVATFHKSK